MLHIDVLSAQARDAASLASVEEIVNASALRILCIYIWVESAVCDHIFDLPEGLFL